MVFIGALYKKFVLQNNIAVQTVKGRWRSCPAQVHGDISGHF